MFVGMSVPNDAQDIIKEGNIIHKIGNSLYDGEENLVAGLPIVTWAQFITDSSDPLVGVDPTKLCNYLISDRLVDPSGQRPIFQVDPLSTAPKKRHLLSKHMYVADFADRPSVSDFPGLPLMIGNFGNAVAVSDGAAWLARGRQYVYNEQNGTLDAPTKSTSASSTSYTFTVAMPNIPANLITPGKTVMRCNYSFQRRGTGGTNDIAIRLGTVGDTLDPFVTYHANVSGTDKRIIRGASRLTFPTSTIFLSSRGFSDYADGPNLLQAGGPTQFNVASPLIVKVYIPAKNAADTIDLIDLEWVWER